MDDLKHEDNIADVKFTSQGSLDAFVNGEQIIDNDYTANLSDGILSLETSSNGNSKSKKINVRDLFEKMSRKDSLKSILLEMKESEEESR
jgi:hypothetical protein